LIPGAIQAILPGPMRKPTTVLALAALAALALAGCGSACQDLADRICSCQPAGSFRDNCKNSVRNQLSNSKPSEAAQAFCQTKLGTCPDPGSDSTACDALKTEAGKVACGLAFPPPTP
jgi:hypothetical protein